MKKTKNPALAQKRRIAFLDFDNTITKSDCLDNIIARFSYDKRWIQLEEKWKRGEIGSRDCLKGQMKCVRISKRALDRYLATVKLDPYFKKLIKLLGKKKVETIILSDNFDYILRRILRAETFGNLNIFANKLGFAKDRLIPDFPFGKKDCTFCGHCKTSNLLENVDRDSTIFFIGDGLSDICPAQYADIVFAKQDLLAYYKNNKAHCLPFKGLKDVYDYFKRSQK